MSTTDDWTANPGGVKSNGPVQIEGPPTWYCFVSVFDSEEGGNVSTIGVYVTVQADGTFSNGLISKSPLYGTATGFTAGNYSGTYTPDPASPHYGTFVGTFSGTLDDGTPFEGQSTFTVGLGYKGIGHGTRIPATRVVAAMGSVVFGTP